MASRNTEGFTQVNIIIDNNGGSFTVDTSYALVSSEANDNRIVWVSIPGHPFSIKFVEIDPFIHGQPGSEGYQSSATEDGFSYLEIPSPLFNAALPIDEDIYQDYPYDLTIELPPSGAAGGSAVAAPSSVTVRAYVRGRRRGWPRH